MAAPKTPLGRYALLALAAVVLFIAGYLIGGMGSHPEHHAQQAGEHAGHEGHAGHDHSEHTVEGKDGEGQTTWTCSMHPNIKLPEPGQCPVCFMDLIPLVEDGDGGERLSLRQLRLTPTARKLAEVAVAPVRRSDLDMATRLVGKVDYDETRLGRITAYMAGRLDTLHVDFMGARVRRGQPMASIYSPELRTAQAELIQAVRTLKNLGPGAMDLVRATSAKTEKAAREKLRLLGLSKDQIEAIAKREEPVDHVTLYAPMGGVVIEMSVREGDYVRTGQTLFGVADLSRLWVVLEAYETDLPWIEQGMDMAFTTEAYPGRRFKGRVAYVDPMVDETTRTVRVRLDVDNPGGLLKPGMFVKAERAAQGGAGGDAGQTRESELVIPDTAPLITGKRAVVYLQAPGDEGLYVGREVVLGPRVGDHYVVREGLEEGDLVVVNGNFKIDSALQILARPSMMHPDGGAVAAGREHHTAAADPGDGGQEGREAPAPEVPDALYDIPGLLSSRLALLAQDARAVHQAAHQAARTGDLEAARQAFGTFYDTLCAIDPTALQGEAALAYKELSMLLKNDAVLGREAEDEDELKRVHGMFSKHMTRLAAAFPLGGDGAPAGYADVVPQAFKDQLGEVYRRYLALQDALAHDRPGDARQAAMAMDAALDAVDMGLLPHAPHLFWMDQLIPMKGALAAMGALEDPAADVDALRREFLTVSEKLAASVESLGVASEGPIYELYCPMAFGNQGGHWLQSDQGVRNPYFGAAMFACGEVSRQIKR